MSVEDHKALASRFVEEVMNAGNTTAIRDLCVPGSRFATGIEGQMKSMKMGFPDNHFTIEDILAEGDLVALRVTTRGTNTGPLLALPAFGRFEQPVPPTGRVVSGTGMYIFKVRDGRIAGLSFELDQLGLLQQLGWTFTPPSQSPRS